MKTPVLSLQSSVEGAGPQEPQMAKQHRLPKRIMPDGPGSKARRKRVFVPPKTRADGLWLGEDRLGRNDPVTRLHCFAAAYKRAGDTLIERALGGGEPDYSIFPIVFLYRHYIELALKCLLVEINISRRQRLEVRRTHDLHTLWAELEGAVGGLPPSVRDHVADVRRSVDEISELDPSSESFRYPFDTEGTPILDQCQLIDLKTLRDSVNRFDGAYRFISEVLNLQIEIDCM